MSKLKTGLKKRVPGLTVRKLFAMLGVAETRTIQKKSTDTETLDVATELLETIPDLHNPEWCGSALLFQRDSCMQGHRRNGRIF